MSPWNTFLPFLWMCLCAIQDDVKDCLRSSGDVLNHAELDAHNSSEHPKTFQQALADKFNDESSAPETEECPDTHQDFSESVSLPFSAMPGKVTVECIKKKWSECKAKLSKVASRCDQSGNGDGQMETAEAMTEEAPEEDSQEEATEEDIIAMVDEGTGDGGSWSDDQDHWAHMPESRLSDGDNLASFLWDHLGESLICFTCG